MDEQPRIGYIIGAVTIAIIFALSMIVAPVFHNFVAYPKILAYFLQFPFSLAMGFAIFGFLYHVHYAFSHQKKVMIFTNIALTLISIIPSVILFTLSSMSQILRDIDQQEGTIEGSGLILLFGPSLNPYIFILGSYFLFNLPFVIYAFKRGEGKKMIPIAVTYVLTILIIFLSSLFAREILSGLA